MKRYLRNLPIKHKLTAITMATSGAALLLACAIFAIYEQSVFRRTMARDFAILADMFDDNVASGLAFNDPASIEQTLQTLQAHGRIVAASVYDKQGAMMGSYRRTGAAGRFDFPAARRTGQVLGADRLDTFKDIELAGEVIGVVYLGAELGELRERAWRYGATVGLLLTGCSLVALGLASRLQRIISQPIVNLARTVAAVAAGKNYNLRAPKQSDDELGRLIDGFNEMLSQIQARDSALQLARDNLEARVEERTRELVRENSDRRRAEAELASSVSVLHATFESTIDGILVVDLAGHLTAYNQTFATLWGIPREILETRDDARALEVASAQLKDPDTFMNKVREMYARPEAESFDVLEMKDGRIIERYTRPQRIGSAIAGRVICFRDITSRRQAEIQLAETHQQLLLASRQAGMAEVATGVLHNVGNVLNSLNVSSAVIATSLRHSKAASLLKVADLLREHTGDLATYLTTDPKGRRLPELIESLGRHLSTERDGLLQEVASLQKNVDHIKEIVSRQQTYATMAGMVEPLDAAALMEESVRINAAMLASSDVHLERDFQPVPQLAGEKGKILQILVNLVRNAQQACEVNVAARRTITLTVGPGPQGHVRLSVHDNGSGIKPENLTRIFAHGFTTKATGHGFGLHSAANAARSMDGTLIAHSDGPGCGATFTLELPAAVPAPALACYPT